MRKTQKSKIYDYFEPIDLVFSNATYIIEGGCLMHRVIWQKNYTFNIIMNKYINYVSNNFGTNAISFLMVTPIPVKILVTEQLRRTAAVSTSCKVHFNESMEVQEIHSRNFFFYSIEQKKIN